MKTCLFVCLAVCLQTRADDEKLLQPTNFAPTVGDYEEYFNKYKTFTEKAFKPEAWADLKFVHKKTNEGKVFKDMTPLEQHTVMLSIGDKFTREMTILESHWEREEKLFDDPKYKPVEKEKPTEKQKAAQKEDVQKFRKDLLALRKQFALDYEKFASSTMDKFQKEIGEKEREFILKQIREKHDEFKLVDRMTKAE